MMKYIYRFKRNVIKDNRGSMFINIFAMFGIFVAILFIALVSDYFLAKINLHVQEEKLEMVNRNVYSLESVEYAAFNVTVQVVDESKALDLFEDMLIENFNLDSSFSPIDQKSFINGPIQIEEFEVITEDELPYDHNGETIEHPGIISIISMPIKTPILGMEGNTTLEVTSAVGR